MSRIGIWISLQLTGLRASADKPKEAGNASPDATFNGYEMLSCQEKQDTHEEESPVHFVSICMLTLGKKVIRNQGETVLAGLKEFCHAAGS